MKQKKLATSIEVKAGKFPGKIELFSMPRGATIKDLIKISRLDQPDKKRGDKFELRLNDTSITHKHWEMLDLPLSDGDMLFQLKFIKGN